MPEPHERATALIGTPFRPQGRNPAIGLDCIGVVLIAYRLPIDGVPRYRLTDGSWDAIDTILSRWFGPAGSFGGVNDLVVQQMPRGFHFGILGPAGLIHADLALRRVVLRPCLLDRALATRFYRFQES